jgi:hypothetical protein
MSTKWDQGTVQQYIRNEVQENLTLEYKGAASLGKTDSKKDEIRKDISAMANSAGGIIIYGIKEFDVRNKRYLPEKIDPVDQTVFTKEWLEQVINGIRPKIDGIIITPVPIALNLSDVVYVVDVPQSTTCHQASDYRYYKRQNFSVFPMEDYEVKDVMNRAIVPNVQIELGLRLICMGERNATYYRSLQVVVNNQGINVINCFKVILVLTSLVGVCDENGFDSIDLLYGNLSWENIPINDRFILRNHTLYDLETVYQSEKVLFPEDEIDIGSMIRYKFIDPGPLDEKSRGEEYWFHPASPVDWKKWSKEKKWTLKWTLYADNMHRKQGEIPICDLPLYKED